VPASLHPPDWPAVGERTGGRKVCVGPYRRPDAATHRLRWTAQEGRQPDTSRHAGAAVLRTGKSQRGRAAWQAGDRRRGTEAPRPQPQVQAPPGARCLVASLIGEHERLDRQLTWRQGKRPLILTGVPRSFPALERVRRAA
jgi:hypothetical protein